MSIDFENCLVPYSEHGISFSWPDIWELEEQADGDDIMISLTSAGTAFWTLRILPECPPPPQVVDSCVAAFREEYEDIEEERPECRLAEMPAYARDLRFFYMELMNMVGLRSVRTSEFTLLVWWQGTDHELEECCPLLDHLTNSVRLATLQ